MVQSVGHSEYELSLTDHITTLPNNVEAERALLGGLMLRTQAWDNISGKVSAGDFYRPDHRLIFEALAVLAERNEPLDAVTVDDYLNSVGKSVEAGGLEYISGLVTNTPSAANITTTLLCTRWWVPPTRVW